MFFTFIEIMAQRILADKQAASIDTQASTIDSQGSAVDTQTTEIASEGSSADTQVTSIDTQASSIVKQDSAIYTQTSAIASQVTPIREQPTISTGVSRAPSNTGAIRKVMTSKALRELDEEPVEVSACNTKQAALLTQQTDKKGKKSAKGKKI
jgi:hypothetical protein